MQARIYGNGRKGRAFREEFINSLGGGEQEVEYVQQSVHALEHLCRTLASLPKGEQR